MLMEKAGDDDDDGVAAHRIQFSKARQSSQWPFAESIANSSAAQRTSNELENEPARSTGPVLWMMFSFLNAPATASALIFLRNTRSATQPNRLHGAARVRFTIIIVIKQQQQPKPSVHSRSVYVIYHRNESHSLTFPLSSVALFDHVH